MADDVVREGGCLCGQVRFQARGRPTNVRICHCRLCQKAMSAPFFARALYPIDQVTVMSSARPAARGCAPRARYRPAMPFDDSNAQPPECHFFVSSKIGWVRLNDDLPQYPEWPPG